MKQRLKKISEHVWILPFDSPKDRPNLGYIRGDKMSLAVDAGHSSSHVEDLYAELEAHSLPLPDLTVITHWHWDHTFGMHAVHGKTIACPVTNRKLIEIRDGMEQDPTRRDRFLRSDPSVRREYAGGIPLVVVPADEEITQDRVIDLGGVTAHVLFAQSPHTEDALLIHVPEDRVLFIGDAQLGEFPSWRMDYDKLYELSQQIRGLEADVVIDGHWMPYKKRDLLDELM